MWANFNLTPVTSTDVISFQFQLNEKVNIKPADE